MCGPENIFEMINFEWNHVLTFLSKNMAKNAVFTKKLITQNIIKQLM